MSARRFEVRTPVVKVSDELGLVFGWGIVCTENGEDYFDLQNDNIPDDAMLKSATDFMLHSRIADDMHDWGNDGPVVFSFPLTAEIQKVFGIQCDKTGLMLAIKPSPSVLEKFKDGTYTGFSIGGERGEDEEID